MASFAYSVAADNPYGIQGHLAVLELRPAGADVILFTVAMHNGGGSVHPGEVAAELLGPAAGEASMVREELLVEHEDGRLAAPLSGS